MAGLKTASGEAIDGSFELQVEVEEGVAVGQTCPMAPPGPTAAPRTLALRVTGDLHVGGLMLLIVETIGARRDWSDHALWWAQRRRWLRRPGRSLDALGVGGTRGSASPPGTGRCACACPTGAACACASPSPSPWPAASPRPAACSGGAETPPPRGSPSPPP
ncbi:fermitin family homolog 3-like [Phalacrocorax carbo]|uniref:fermitin family homolog 3-like n=1 Tax=Phalacrocorax carbo TaxID=9209 RepID=UPI0031198A0B